MLRLFRLVHGNADFNPLLERFTEKYSVPQDISPCQLTTYLCGARELIPSSTFKEHTRAYKTLWKKYFKEFAYFHLDRTRHWSDVKSFVDTSGWRNALTNEDYKKALGIAWEVPGPQWANWHTRGKIDLLESGALPKFDFLGILQT